MSDVLNNKMGRVTFEGDRATIEFERYFPHPPEKVWGAITENAQLSSWYISRAKINGGDGGSVEFWFGKPNFHVTGSIRVWEPPHIFEHEWNIEPRIELPEGEYSTVRWELSAEKGGTAIKLIHANLTRQTATGMIPWLAPLPAGHVILENLEFFLDEKPVARPDQRMASTMEEYNRILGPGRR